MTSFARNQQRRMAIRTPDSVTSSATPAFGRSRIEEQDSTWVCDIFSDFFRGTIRDIFQAHGRHLGAQCPSDCGGAPVTSRWNFDVEPYFERTRAFVTFSRKLMLAMDRSISEIEDQDCDIFELARPSGKPCSVRGRAWPGRLTQRGVECRIQPRRSRGLSSRDERRIGPHLGGSGA